MKLDQLIDTYFSCHKDILEAFGYQEVWRDCPLTDERGMWWAVSDSGLYYASSAANVLAGLCEDCVIEGDDDEDEITGSYYKFFLYEPHNTEAVFRADNFTLVRADTQTDGNIYCFILSNDKEIKIGR